MIEPLSPRELEILQALQSGMSNRQIAAEAGITQDTVKFHLKNVYGKLGIGGDAPSLNKRMTAVQIARADGLLQQAQA